VVEVLELLVQMVFRQTFLVLMFQMVALVERVYPLVLQAQVYFMLAVEAVEVEIQVQVALVVLVLEVLAVAILTNPASTQQQV
jgi:hypothetical protein